MIHDTCISGLAYIPYISDLFKTEHGQTDYLSIQNLCVDG